MVEVLRRKKLGEFFFDIAKFSVTVGIIGRFISEDVDVKAFGLILIGSAIALILGWFILPREGGNEQ